MCGYVPGLNGPEDDEAIPGAPLEGRLEVPAEITASAPTERTIAAPGLGTHMLLAIDTSLGSSVALGANGRVVEVSSDDTRGHAEVIGGLIARAFELAQVAPSEVTGVVSGIGPGPFTGLRIGIAAARAFATGRRVPLLPLHGHEAVAMTVLEHASTAPVRVVQDAKRRELFVTDYRGVDWSGLPMRRADPRLELRVSFETTTADLWPERVPAARLVLLAARRLAVNADFEAPQALYLRAPDVKPAAAVKRVSA